VLAGTAPLADLLRPGPVEGLSVLPAGVVPPNPGELLLSPRFGELLEELGRSHDLIVLDTPPILPVADVLAVMRHVAAARPTACWPPPIRRTPRSKACGPCAPA